MSTDIPIPLIDKHPEFQSTVAVVDEGEWDDFVHRYMKLERVVEAIKFFDFQPFHQGTCGLYRGGACDCTTSKITGALAALGDE